MRASLLLLLLAGCARGPAPSRAQSHAGDAAPALAAPATAAALAGSVAPVAPVASVAPIASVAPALADAGPPPPLPVAPPGADPEKVKLAASICAAATFRHPLTKQLEVGCRSHPPFDRPEQKPDGKLPAFTDDPLRFCALEKIYRGSFSRPGAKQAALSFGQCKENDPDATWDMGFPGNMLLVEEVAGRWTTIAYAPAVNTSNCLQSRRTDGRDVLLCRSGLNAGSSGEVQYFFAMDFGDPYKATFLGWEHGLVSLRMGDVSLADVNQDGTPDLVVQVLRARAAPSPGLEAKVRASCKQLPGASAAPVLPPPKRTTLHLVSSAKGFAPSAAAKTELDAWESEAPERFNGLTQVVPE